MINMQTDEQDGVKILTLSGRLDGDGSIRLHERINEEIDYDKDSLLLDMSEVEYISSAGLRVLILATRTIKNEFGLCNPTSMVREVFTMTKLDSALFIYDDMATALQSMSD
ncbi:MAG: anti-anti-sigma factor [Lysobacterales bacterium]|jgi:anti-anti-sigma factor